MLFPAEGASDHIVVFSGCVYEALPERGGLSPSNLILINTGINSRRSFIQFYVLPSIQEKFRLSEKVSWRRESNESLKAGVSFASDANSPANQSKLTLTAVVGSEAEPYYKK